MWQICTEHIWRGFDSCCLHRSARGRALRRGLIEAASWMYVLVQRVLYVFIACLVIFNSIKDAMEPRSSLRLVKTESRAVQSHVHFRVRLARGGLKRLGREWPSAPRQGPCDQSNTCNNAGCSNVLGRPRAHRDYESSGIERIGYALSVPQACLHYSLCLASLARSICLTGRHS